MPLMGNNSQPISFHVGPINISRGTKRTAAPDSADYDIDSDNTSSSSSQFDVPEYHDEGIIALLFFLHEFFSPFAVAAKEKKKKKKTGQVFLFLQVGPIVYKHVKVDHMMHALGMYI